MTWNIQKNLITKDSENPIIEKQFYAVLKYCLEKNKESEQ
jgi:hypothetical protein